MKTEKYVLCQLWGILGIGAILLFGPFAQVQANAPIFEDDFGRVSLKDVDRTKWTTVEGDAASFGRTVIRNPNIPDVETLGLPQVVPVVPSLEARPDPSDMTARLRLDTYNPTDHTTHTTLWGSEIDTGHYDKKNNPQNKPIGEPVFDLYDIAKYPNGICFEADVRIPPETLAQKGLVLSVFAYGLNPGGTTRDEIDFELLTNLNQTNHNWVFLNYYNNGGFNNNPGELALQKQVNGLDLSQFNNFKIDLFQNHIEWLVNDTLVYTEPRNNIPQDPMGLRINIWAPTTGDWPLAGSPDLKPALMLGENKPFFYEVKNARVSAITPADSTPPQGFDHEPGE